MPTPKLIDLDPTGKIFDFSNEEWEDSRNEKNPTNRIMSPQNQDPLIISFSQTMNHPVLELLDGSQQGTDEQPSMNFTNPEDVNNTH